MTAEKQNSNASILKPIATLSSDKSRQPEPVEVVINDQPELSLHGANIEEQFKRAVLGSPETMVGKYQCYTDFSVANEVVVFLHDSSGQSEHKYIIAEGAGKTFIVAAPIVWTPLHREILKRISAAIGTSAHCPGGGWVSIAIDGRLVVDRRSMDFGEGDHDRARLAFERAISNSKYH